VGRMRVTFDDIDGESSHQVSFTSLSKRTLGQYKEAEPRLVHRGIPDFRVLPFDIEPTVDPTWEAAELLEAHDAKIDDFPSLDEVPARLIRPAAQAMKGALRAAHSV